MQGNAIELEGVWKEFPLRRDRPGFKEFIVNLPRLFVHNGRRKADVQTFSAIKGIDLRIETGGCVGIIGRNGAGKSTLLSLILGAIRPTRGTVKVARRVTPLLELGAGFHPDLTGRENVIINGVLLGLMKAEVMERMDAIVEFSGIGEFVDQPARTYSSGMFMRLAFSVAVHTDPDLLVIDEILSVGDKVFQEKSKSELLRLIQSGVTTVFVSHDMDAVREICQRVVWIDQGAIRGDGDPQEVVARYLES